MYNVYMYDKEQKEKEESLQKKIKEKKQKHSHDLLTNKLAKNYEGQVKKFILDLTKKPIIIKDYNSFSANQSSEKKGFNFCKYVTEKERIEKYLREKNYDFSDNPNKKNMVYDYSYKNNNSGKGLETDRNLKSRKGRVELMDKNNDETLYHQPNMRFKARNDLERVVESMTKNNCNIKNMKLIEKRINNLGLKQDKSKKKKSKKKNLIKSNKYNFNKSTSFDIDESSSSEEENNINDKKNNNNKSKFMMNSHFKRLKEYSSSMRELMGTYNVKTHFKSAKQYADKFTYNNQMKMPKTKSEMNIFSPYKTERQNRSKWIIDANTDKRHQKTSNNINALCINPNFPLTTTENEVSCQIKNSIFREIPLKFPVNVANYDIITTLPLLYSFDHQNENQDKDEYPIENTNTKSNISGYEDKIENLKYIIQQKDKKGTEKMKDPYKKGAPSSNSNGEEENEGNAEETNSDLLGNGVGLQNKIQPSLIKEEINKRKGYEFKGKIVEIDGEVIPISKVDIIYNKVLRKCNYIHPKSVHNNKTLHKGEGKLMCTGGMMIKDFENKYNL